jgi:hypothetical protein
VFQYNFDDLRFFHGGSAVILDGFRHLNKQDIRIAWAGGTG